MATLKVLCGVMWFAIAGGVPTQEKSLEITLDMLNRKLTAMQSQEIHQQKLISELVTKISHQADRLDEMETENKLLNDKVAKLESSLDELQGTQVQQASRQRRQILNTTYEGPVAFMASFGPHCQSNLGINQNVVFGTVQTNLGGAYNALHGVFVAPRAGVYLFASSLTADAATVDSLNVHAAITVNGKKVAKILAIAEANRHRDQGANTIIVDLKQGDQVWVKNIDNAKATICGINGFSTFAGYMLYPY